MIVIDMTNSLIGRVGTKVAKAALEGEEVKLVNCEKAVISGDKAHVLDQFKRKSSMGTPRKGPFQPRMADRLVRKKIRGMLPYKTTRGRDAYERIMCYIGIPEEFANQKIKVIEEASADKLPLPKRITVEEICKVLK